MKRPMNISRHCCAAVAAAGGVALMAAFGPAGWALAGGTLAVALAGTLLWRRQAHERRTVREPAPGIYDDHERRETLVDNSPALLWVDGCEGCEFVNHAGREFLGLTTDPVTRGDAWSRFVHEEDRARYLNVYRRSFAAGTAFTTEIRLRRSDREWRWMHVEAKPRFDRRGLCIGYSGAMIDITERKLAEEELRLRDRAMAASDAGLLIVDATRTDMPITFVSKGFERLCGYSASEVLGRNCRFLQGPETDRADVARIRAALCAGDAVRVTLRNYRKDGTTFWNDLAITPVRDASGRLTHFIGIQNDVTQRIEIQAALRDREERIQQALHVSRSFTFDWDPASDRVRRSASCGPILRMVGDEAENDTGRQFFQRVHPEDRSRLVNAVKALTPQAPSYATEYRVVRGDGQTVTLEEDAQGSFNAGGALVRVVGVTTDITARKQAEVALHTAGRSFRHLIEQSPFGVYAVDADFRLAIVSAGAQALFSNVRPLLGRDFEEVLHVLWPEPFLSEVLGRFRHTLTTGEPYHAPISVERRTDSGETKAYDWKIDQVTLPDGRPGVICHFYDFSEHQRYEENLRIARSRLETALHASQVVLFHQDRDLRYTWIHNPALGYAANEVLGKRDSDLFQRAEDAARVEALKQSVIDTGVPQREEVCIMLDGRPLHYDLLVQPDRDANGRTNGVNCAAVDVTDRKRAEAALADAVEQLRIQDKRKTDFLATLAHELRNPLAPIRTGLHVMKLAGADAGSVDKLRSMMERQIGQMARLIDDLMDLTRISRDRIVLQTRTMRVADAVHDAIDASRPLIESQEHLLTVGLPDEPIELDGDLTRLCQVFANLLNNAAKYTGRGGRIQITVERHADDAVVAVRDNGIGIAADKLHSIFELFNQVTPSANDAHGGLGIGLSISKRLVELHGGTIEARSEGPGCGSEFVVRLPVALHPAAPAGDGEEEPVPPVSLRILIVDDNRDAATSLAIMLELRGHVAGVAFDGRQGVEEAERMRPDAILLDIGLPTLDGYQACRHIRARAWGKTMILIAVTGWGQDEDRQRSAEAGFDHHLVKPVDPDVLMNVLARLHRERSHRASPQHAADAATEEGGTAR